MCIVTQVPGHEVLPTRTAYAGFAVFGAFWGAWGASIPAIRDAAGVTDGQLGTALLFVGAGAVPAMLATGRAVDRWRRPVTAIALAALGLAGVAVAATARDFASLSIGLAVLGASSGAADVAINAAAGSAQRATARPVLTRAHGVFSAMVVVVSLLTGASSSLGAPVVTPFLVVAVGAGAAAIGVGLGPPTEPRTPVPEPTTSTPTRFAPLLVIGALGAMAFAVENAHQSWSAVFLGSELEAGPVLASAGPAVFAAVVALTRFSISPLGARLAPALVATGAATAAAGTVVMAGAPTTAIALVGLAIAAAGTAVVFPLLLGVLTAEVEDRARGRATSIVTTVAYLGFVAGPIYVGRWADAMDLRAALLAVAGLAAVLAAATLPALRSARRPASR